MASVTLTHPQGRPDTHGHRPVHYDRYWLDFTSQYANEGVEVYVSQMGIGFMKDSLRRLPDSDGNLVFEALEPQTESLGNHASDKLTFKLNEIKL